MHYIIGSRRRLAHYITNLCSPSHLPRSCLNLPRTEVITTAPLWAAMLVFYVSVWPFVIFAWRDRWTDTVGEGGKERRSRLRRAARAKLCDSIMDRDHKGTSHVDARLAAVDGSLEDFGHVHTITQRLGRPGLTAENEERLEEEMEWYPSIAFMAGVEEDFEQDAGMLSYPYTLLR